MSDVSPSSLAAARVLMAEQATREWFVVTAVTRSRDGLDCWLGMLRDHLAVLLDEPLVLPPHVYAGVLGRVMGTVPGSEFERQVELASERMNVGPVIAITRAWCEQVRTSANFVSQPVGNVELDGQVLAARLLLFTADTPRELVGRAQRSGLDVSELELVCAPRFLGMLNVPPNPD